MNYNRFKKLFLPCVALAGAFALAGCTDNDYDLNEVDATMGFGGDGLSLPVSSTDTIKLADVLELDGSDCVVEKENGDYVFEQKGNKPAPSRPSIDPIRVACGTPVHGDIVISAPVVPGVSTVEITADGGAQTFTYEGDVPDEVVELTHVGCNSSLTFNVVFPQNLAQAVSSIRTLNVTMPSFMEFTVDGNAPAHTREGNTLRFTNVPTNRNLNISVTMTGFNITNNKSRQGGAVVSGGKINIEGTINIDVAATANVADAQGLDGQRITSTLNISEIAMTSARGRFNPEIDIKDFGEVEVTGVPDFLTDGDVRVDLYNPIINLVINNNMPLGGKITSATITAYRDGNTETAEVSDIDIKASGTTNVLLCRTADGINAEPGTTVKTVPGIENLIMRIPDRITFDAHVEADAATECEFLFGNQGYEVQPEYSFEAPIAFAENANIVYKDTLDGWNEDIEDFDLSEGAYVNIDATIENRMPAYLNLSVVPVDVEGNEISSADMTVEVTGTVLASGKEDEPAYTPINVKLTQNSEGALKRLDGLAFKVEASASEDGHESITGQTLNARKHFLIARDLKVKVVGKIIGDFN